MRTLIVGVVAAALLLSLGGARAAAGSITLNSGQESQVAAFNLATGDAIEYTFSTGVDVLMRIERVGTEVFNTTGPTAHGTFTASTGGQYTVFFRNDGAYMTGVSYSIDERTNPANAAGNLLLIGGIGAGVAAAAGVGAALALRARGKRAHAQTRAPPPPPPSQ